MICRFYRFLFRIMPFESWQVFWYRKHLASCPDCQKKVEMEDGWPLFFISTEQVPGDFDLWPGIETELPRSPKAFHFVNAPDFPRPFRLRLSVVIAATGFLVFLLWVMIGGRIRLQEQALLQPARSSTVVLRKVHVEGGAAKVYSFLSRNPDRAIFWLARSKNGG